MEETVNAAMSQAQELAASAEDYASNLISSAKENTDTLYHKLNSRSSVLLVEAERNAAILKQAVDEYAESKRMEGEEQFKKNDPVVVKMKEWVDEQYANGRNTGISNRELRQLLKKILQRGVDGEAEEGGLE